MNHLFSPLLPRDPLEGPVLVLAAHPDDEVIGAGSMLAYHASRGHAVTVVHATDGAAGDPNNREAGDIRDVRRAEGDVRAPPTGPFRTAEVKAPARSCGEKRNAGGRPP